MAEFAALPLFTDALLADTGHLSDEEFGRYVRILIIMWRSPDCRIPNDKDWIAKRLHVDPLRVDAVAMPLLKEFCKNDGNWWTQKRLQKEFEYVRKKSKRQSETAKSRWDKEKKSSRGNAKARHNNGILSGNAPTPSPTPTDSEDTKVSSCSKRFSEFWNRFPNQRKGNRNKALSAYASAVKNERATEEEIHAGLERYIQSEEVKLGFAKGAAAWLNDDRWGSDFTRGRNAASGGVPAAGRSKSERARDVLIRSAEDVDAFVDGRPGRKAETD